MGLPWERIFAGSEQRLKSSAIRDLLAVTAQPDVISFAGGLPAPELFPVDGIRESFERVMRAEGAAALQYGPTEGHMPLRAFLAERLSMRGVKASPEEILITTGSQQALGLLGTVLLPRGSSVLIEAPSYVGALQAFTLHEPRYLPIRMDSEGIVVEDARQVLKSASVTPAFAYTVATFQNPSGVTMSLERRTGLLALSREFDLPLIEDDPYGDLRFSGAAVPAFRALDGGDDAVYLGTFSKTLAPGLRLGYVVAPRALISRLVLAKQAADLHTDSLAQRAVLDFCQHNDLAAHVAELCAVYRRRRDAMLSALRQYMPSSCSWTEPDGGLFTWVTLPEHVNTTELLREAVERKVAFVPGNAFFTDGSGGNTMRLNFSHPSPEKIEEGVRRLGELVTQRLSNVDQGSTFELAGSESR
jgi:2-aminoadipate transaminase